MLFPYRQLPSVYGAVVQCTGKQHVNHFDGWIDGWRRNHCYCWIYAGYRRLRRDYSPSGMREREREKERKREKESEYGMINEHLISFSGSMIKEDDNISRSSFPFILSLSIFLGSGEWTRVRSHAGCSCMGTHAHAHWIVERRNVACVRARVASQDFHSGKNFTRRRTNTNARSRARRRMQPRKGRGISDVLPVSREQFVFKRGMTSFSQIMSWNKTRWRRSWDLRNCQLGVYKFSASPKVDRLYINCSHLVS